MGISESLKKELEARKKKTGDLPPWWEPKETNPDIVGTISKIRTNPWEAEKWLYEVTDENGETWTLPCHIVLMNALSNLNVHEGDAVLIHYLGEVQSKKGRDVKDYEVGFMRADEAAKFGSGTPTGTPMVPEKPRIPSVLEEPKKADFGSASYEVGPVSSKEVKAYVDKLLDLFQEMDVKEFEAYLRKSDRFKGMDALTAANLSGCVIADGKVKRKK